MPIRAGAWKRAGGRRCDQLHIDVLTALLTELWPTVCGLAGGTPWGADALEAGDYVNTTYAHHGTRGSTLPKMPTGTVWKIGGEAPVSWNVRNNHGGGYSASPLTTTLPTASNQGPP